MSLNATSSEKTPQKDEAYWYVPDQVAGVEFVLELPSWFTGKARIIVQRVETGEIILTENVGNSIILKHAGIYWLRANPMLQSTPFAVVAGSAKGLRVIPENWPIASGGPCVELVDACGNAVSSQSTVTLYFSEGTNIHQVSRVPMYAGRATFLAEETENKLRQLIKDIEYAMCFFEAIIQKDEKFESTAVTFTSRQILTQDSSLDLSEYELRTRILLEQRRGIALAKVAAQAETKATTEEMKLQQITCAGKLRVDATLRKAKPKYAVKALREAVFTETATVQRLESELTSKSPAAINTKKNTLSARDQSERTHFLKNNFSIELSCSKDDLTALDAQRQDALREFLLHKVNTSDRVANLRAAMAEIVARDQVHLRRLCANHCKLLPTRRALLEALKETIHESIMIPDNCIVRLNTKWRLSIIEDALKQHLTHFNLCATVQQLGLSSRLFPLSLDPHFRLSYSNETDMTRESQKWIDFWTKPKVDTDGFQIKTTLVYQDPYCALLFFYFLAQREDLSVEQCNDLNLLVLRLKKLDVICIITLLPLQLARIDTFSTYLQRLYVEFSVPTDAHPADVLEPGSNGRQCL